MKKRMRRAQALAVVILIMVVGACTAPFAPSGSVSDILGDLGGLRFSRLDGQFSSGEPVFSAQTALPRINYDEITFLRITLSEGPAGSDPQETVVSDVAFTAEGTLDPPIEIEDLIPGEWTLTVEAFNTDPNSEGAGVILQGSSVITVTAGAYAEIDGVSVQPIDNGGNGAWEFTATWPEETDPDYPLTDVVDQIAYRVDDGAWQTVPAATSATDGRYEQVISGTDVPPGDYQIAVELRATGKPAPYNVVARHNSIYRVYSNVTTRATNDFTSSDFAYGGGARLTVNIDLPEDLEGFFAGTPDSTVIAGETYTIDAGTLSGSVVDTYTWRVDFQEVAPEPDETTLEIDTTADQAGQVLLIVLIVEVDGRPYSGEHRVRILQPE